MEKRWFLLLFLMIFSLTVLAEDRPSVNIRTKISELHIFARSGMYGDVLVRTVQEPKECEGGFFLRNTASETYKNMLSFLFSAYRHPDPQLNFGVILAGSPKDWAGSAKNNQNKCELMEVGLSGQ